MRGLFWRTSARSHVAREWLQLDVDPDTPERLVPGFSGAGVYDMVTGEVVGMVTDADLEHDGPGGKMLPVDALRIHWEDLDELLPLDWLDSGEVRVLRGIVAKAECRSPLREIYLRTFPDRPPNRDFRSVWDAIRYVAEELLGTDDKDRLARFLDRLAQNLPDDVAHQLTAWRCRLLAEPEQTGSSNPSIIVRLDRRTHEFELTTSVFPGDRAAPYVPPMRVRDGQVRAAVKQRIRDLLPLVSGKEWMVEFALPKSWLGRAVEDWTVEQVPLRSRPLPGGCRLRQLLRHRTDRSPVPATPATGCTS